MGRDQSILGKLFDGANYLFLSIYALLTLIPFVYVVVSSFSGSSDVIPTTFTLDAYRYIFSTNTFVNSIFISVYITLLGTSISLVLTSLTAYALAHRTLMGRRTVSFMILFTMLFHGGMIPTYFVVKSLGLLNTLWALMIPNAISAFYLIVLRSFFQNIPDEIKESGRIDGCHELGMLFRIVIPLSLPAMAAFGLFYAVMIWNQYFSAILYISDNTKWPIQVILNQVLRIASGGSGDGQEIIQEGHVSIGNALKMAVIVISTVPILLVYPFLQKHFAKGVLLGSVKG